MADQRKESDRNIRLLLSLIERTSTLEKTKGFLAARKLHFSAGSWKELVEARIEPALQSDALAADDLLEFLCESEEHGGQHIFLFRIDPDTAKQLADRVRIRVELRRRGLQTLLDRPLILDKPEAPQIVDVRWEQEERFLVKIVEPRSFFRQIDERREGNIITTVREEIIFRAVNLLRLHSDGLLEMRLQSHKNSSQYSDDINRAWDVVGTILPRVQFVEEAIVAAKTFMVREQQKLKDEIRYSDSLLKDDNGYVLSAATPDQDSNLFDNSAAARSLEQFMRPGGTYCERLNIWVSPLSGGQPSKSSIHVRLAGLPNEFALTTACSKQDYEYVLARIRECNR